MHIWTNIEAKDDQDWTLHLLQEFNETKAFSLQFLGSNGKS